MRCAPLNRVAKCQLLHAMKPNSDCSLGQRRYYGQHNQQFSDRALSGGIVGQQGE